MIARLWEKEIIAGNKTFKEVPPKLKDKVKELLIADGREDLIIE